ncbi:MAG: hypothetical protein KF845_11385 [Cyclobacteriaceae bacterium]|nr:hypothetical protein [Cyclobacteriaceae bacterium]
MKEGVFSMEWTTVYIAGKPGFKDEVLNNLLKSNFPFMPGSPESDSLYLLWMDDRHSLRELKKAIGSKTVFKYRLNFYPSLEKYFESLRSKKKEVTFTPQEEELIQSMIDNLQEYKVSA